MNLVNGHRRPSLHTSPRRSPRGRWRTVLVLLTTSTGAVLWHGRQRFLSAVLAVMVSAALINAQWGLVLGVFATSSIPVDRAPADLWVGAPGLDRVDAGRRISLRHLARVAGQPEVTQAEPLVLELVSWVKPDGTQGPCIIVGSRLSDTALGAARDLTGEQRARLAEPGAVVVDRADMGRLGVRQIGDTAEVRGHRVRVVGWVSGLKGLNAPFVFCALDTARQLLGCPPDQATYLVARCRTAAEASSVAQRLGGYTDLSAFTRADFSQRTRLTWLTQTPGGLVTALMAALTLLVGALVTCQTLYAATAASAREYAVLRALGFPAWRIGTLILCQALGVGLAGALLALPPVFLLDTGLSALLNLQMILPWWLLAGTSAVTVLMAVAAGLATLRTLRLMNPNTLLR